MADGESFEATAADLGISAMSVKRWTERYGRSTPGKAELRRVEVVAEQRRPMVVPSASALVVHTPAGLRIDGLSLADLSALVRAVG